MSFYLLINGEARGPYAEAELRDMLAHREVSSSTPACRAGESEWGTVDSCLAPQAAAAGLVNKPKTSIPARFAASAAVETSSPEPSRSDGYSSYYSSSRTPIRNSYERAGDRPGTEKQPGIGRVAYFLTGSGVTVFGIVLQFLLGADVLMMVYHLAALVGNLVLIYLRVINIGWSGKWCLVPMALLVAPFLGVPGLRAMGSVLWMLLISAMSVVAIFNLYLSIMCLAAPPGYARIKKFDPGGKIVLWVMVVLVLISVLAIVAAIAIPNIAGISEAAEAARASRSAP